LSHTVRTVYAYKTKTLKPMPAALVPRMTATRSIIKTPPKNPVWKQFMVKNVAGFSASRMNKTMARMSMSRQMVMKSMKTTTLLHNVSTWYVEEVAHILRNGWLRDISNLINHTESICVDSNEEHHDANPHDPERHEHTLLP
jgi:hypothetical protein